MLIKACGALKIDILFLKKDSHQPQNEKNK